jgi:hypothetical protein
MPQPRVLLVGSTARREFRDVRAAIGPLADVTPAADMEAAAAILSDAEIVPELIVVVQAFPGQFSAEAVDRLRLLAPLARIVGLMGSWCEGEMRSGKPWPAAVRVYWHQWPAQCAQQLGRMREGACGAWGLPATASEEERVLSLAEQPGGPSAAGLIAIHTPWFEMHDWLAAACRRRGYSTAWLRPGQSACVRGARAAIFDATECVDEEAQALSRLAAAVRPAPVVALLDFPRVDDRDGALTAGAAAVLAKPLLIDDLFWLLERNDEG